MENQDSSEDRKLEPLIGCNPVPIDERYLAAIENGDVELTDNRFFELIKENPMWLSTGPFLRKIIEWQYVLGVSIAGTCFGAGMSSPEDSKKAKDNLLRIGNALAYEGQGRPKKVDDTTIYLKYRQLENGITNFFADKDIKSTSRLPTLLKAYPEYLDCFNLRGRRRPNSSKEIAIAILVKKYGWSQRAIRSAISENKAMPAINRDKLTGK